MTRVPVPLAPSPRPGTAPSAAVADTRRRGRRPAEGKATTIEAAPVRTAADRGMVPAEARSFLATQVHLPPVQEGWAKLPIRPNRSQKMLKILTKPVASTKNP
jgi:hypothetical protein